MKVLVYGINFSPELTGVGKYTGDMVDWLFAAGHQVHVITAPPHYPGWQVAPGFRAWRYAKEREERLTIWRCPLWVPVQPSGLNRLVCLASFAISSLPMLMREVFWRPDVVWVVEPSLMCAPGALALSKTCGARSWLHIQDYEIDAAFKLGLLRSRLLQRLLRTSEYWLMRRFDRISTISGRMLALAESKGVDSDRLVSFPNWVELQEVVPFDGQGSVELRAELGIAPEAIVALYSGSMGRKQGLDILSTAAELLQGNSTVIFVFCGGGAGRGDLVAACDGLPNVRFLELQPLERLWALLGLADIHLLPQRADAADLVMPSKLTGMLASGRPVVATCAAETELANVVGGCGLITPPEDAAALAGAVLSLSDDRDLRMSLGLNARRYAEQNLDRSSVLSKFEQALQECVDVIAG